MHDKRKFEPRIQMKRALKPRGVTILKVREPYFNAYVIRIFTSNAFSICLRVTL